MKKYYQHITCGFAQHLLGLTRLTCLGLGLVAVLMLSSCEKEYNLYDGAEYLQFGPEQKRIYNANYNLADTVKTYTFVYENSEVMQDTIYFDLYALGGPKDHDRPFVLSQVLVKGEENAEAGVHYYDFNDPEVAELYSVKAGVSHYALPIVLKRDTSLRSRTVVLKLKLESNEYFETGDVDLLWRKVYFTDELIRPNLWTASYEKTFFGKYSWVKHRFMIDQTGQHWDDEFFTSIMVDYGLVQYWAAKVKAAVLEYNTAHPDAPLRDEDGELIVVP